MLSDITEMDQETLVLVMSRMHHCTTGWWSAAFETEQTNLDMYADDSILRTTGENADDLEEQKICSDIGNIVYWCDDKMVI